MSLRRRLLLLASSTSWLVLLLGAAAPARPPAAGSGGSQPAERERFAESSQVVSVQVPVNVVGRDGSPLRGLAAADFEVYDEGAKQKLTSFEVIDLEQQPAGAEARRLEQLDSSARRHFLLLFDLSFSSPAAVLKARVAAREFVLHALKPADLAAVATYSLESGPRLVVTFTPDRAQLARGIETLGLQEVFDAAAKNDPLRFVITPPDMLGLDGAGGPALPEQRSNVGAAMLENLTYIRKAAERAEKTFGRNQIKSFARSFADMARALDAVKGRKNVILFSEGFDSRLLLGRETFGAEADEDQANIEAGLHHFVDNDDRFGNTQLQTQLQRMYAAFQRADCVIQAVDIGGLRAGGSAEDAPRPNGQEGLFVLANETGGELFKDANNFGEQLQRVLARTAVTYVLTFERSDLKPDGSFHRLRVKGRLPAGARISHRAGYFAPRPFKDLDPLEKSLLASDGIASAAPRRDLDVHLLVSPFRAGDKSAYVPVIIEVAGGPLLAGQQGDKLNVEFYTYVSNTRGEMRDFFTQRVSIDIKKGREAVLAAGVKYYGHVELPSGDYRVRVLVRNSETGRTGVESLPLAVPSYQEAQPVLLQPFFIDAQRGWLMVRERGGEKEQGSVVYPFTVKGEPFVPAALATVAREAQARLCLVGYNLGRGQLEVQGKVTLPNGQALAGGRLDMVERTATGVSGLDKLLFTFRPTGLDAGPYVLQVAVTDPKTGRKQTNSTPFQVMQPAPPGPPSLH